MKFKAVDMTNIHTHKIEFYTVLVKRPGKSYTYCCDENGMLKFETMEEARREAKQLTKEYSEKEA